MRHYIAAMAVSRFSSGLFMWDAETTPRATSGFTEFQPQDRRELSGANASSYMYANHGLRKRDERQLALGLLSTMARARVEAETITYNAAISTCDETRVATRIGPAQHDGKANLPVTVRLSVHTRDKSGISQWARLARS